MSYIVKIWSKPVEHGFVNGFTEWAKPTDNNIFGVTREPANATRYVFADAEHIALDYQFQLGDAVHVSVNDPETLKQVWPVKE